MRALRTPTGLLAFMLIAAAPLTAQTAAELRTAEGVYSELARQFQDGRTPPGLELSEAFGEPAMFWPKREAVVLESAAYEVARSLGADSLNALAYLLGHELAHFYGEHAERAGFLRTFSQLAVADTLAAMTDNAGRRARVQFERQQRLQLETEADLKAGFAAYLAGYEPLPVAPALLRSLYSTYRLDTAKVGGHPPLSDRIRVAEIAGETLNGLIQMFEGGVAMLVIGRYDEAARVFDHLVRAFPSREMLSNAGTARALRALELLGDDVDWVYPFELDVETRLKGSRGGLGFSGNEEAERLLREAQTLFDQARLRDPQYLPAWVNLAAVHQILGDDDFAIVYAERAVKLAEELGEEAPRAHAHIVRGIAMAERGDDAAARADFEAAAAAAPSFSAANLEVLSGGDPVFGFASAEKERLFSTETVAGLPDEGASPREVMIALTRRMGTPDINVTLPATGRSAEAGLRASRFDGAQGFMIGNPSESIVLVLSTGDDYRGASAGGVRIGSSLDAVREAYGEAGQVVATRQGAYHVYRLAQIAFAVDADQQVTGWLTWYVDQ